MEEAELLSLLRERAEVRADGSDEARAEQQPGRELHAEDEEAAEVSQPFKGLVELGRLSLDPRDIRYSQKMIDPYFRAPAAARGGGPGGGPSILDTLQQLRGGQLRPEQLPMIRVVQKQEGGRYFSLDNRRLWVLKAFGEVVEVQVRRGWRRRHRLPHLPACLPACLLSSAEGARLPARPPRVRSHAAALPPQACPPAPQARLDAAAQAARP
jgi:hypothetical protein